VAAARAGRARSGGRAVCLAHALGSLVLVRMQALRGRLVRRAALGTLARGRGCGGGLGLAARGLCGRRGRGRRGRALALRARSQLRRVGLGGLTLLPRGAAVSARELSQRRA